MKQLKLIEFIKDHNNWEELLQQEPYCLKIKRDNNYIIFNYNQIMSDFSNSIVKEAAEKLPYNEEGYVVVDKYWNRVKIKSPSYVNAHRLVNNHVVNKEKVLDLIRANEQGEFLSYFPEYKEIFNKVEKELKIWKEYLKLIEYFVNEVKNKLDRKEFALIIQDIFSYDNAFAFQLYNGIVNNSEEYIEKLTNKKIIERIELYD